MNWIKTLQGNVLDLDQEVGLLSILGAIDSNYLTRFKSFFSEDSKIQEINNSFELLALFASTQDEATKNAYLEQINTLLAAGGSEVQVGPELLTAINNRFNVVPEQYLKLLYPVSRYVEDSDNKNPGLLDWTLLDDASARTLSSEQSLAVQLAGKGMLQVEAGHRSELAQADATKRYIRVGVAANADVSASAKIPLQYGSLGLSAGAEGSLAINYLREHQPASETFATAAAKSVQGLVNPVELEQLWQAKRQGLQDFIRLDTQGETFFNTTINLAKSADLYSVIDVTAGLSLDARVSAKGNYGVVVDTTQEALTVSVSKKSSRGYQFKADLSVVVNAAQFAERIKDQLSAVQAEWLASYETLQVYLQPGTLIKEKLNESLQALELDETLVNILALSLGQADANAVKTEITEIISGELSTVASVWNSELEQGTDDILTSAIRKYPVLGHSQIKAQLSQLISQQSGQLQQQLKTEVEQFSEQQLAELIGKLERSGMRVNRGLAQLDQAFAGVRSMLQRYVTRVQTILKKLEELATNDIHIQAYVQNSVESGYGLEASASFYNYSEQAGEVLQELLLGDLNKLFARLDNPVPGVTLELHNWQTYKKYTRTTGHMVKFLDLAFGGETIFSSDVVISGENNQINVESKAEWARRKNAINGEVRAFKFLSVASILQIQAVNRVSFSRTHSVGLTLSQTDEYTHMDDLDGFLEKLEDHDLIPNGSKSAVEQLRHDWAAKARDNNLSTSISAMLALDSTHLRKLLFVESELPNDIYFIQQALDAKLIVEDEISDNRLEWGREALEILDRRNNRGAASNKEIGELIFSVFTHKRRVGQESLEKRLGNIDRNRKRNKDGFNALKAVYEDAIDLRRLIQNLRAVYLSTPDPLGKNGFDKDDYTKIQKIIDSSLGKWIAIKTKGVFWLSDEVSNQILAFILVILDIAGYDLDKKAPMVLQLANTDTSEVHFITG